MRRASAIIVTALLLGLAGPLWAAGDSPVPGFTITVGEGASARALPAAVQILALLTVLSLAPALAMMVTSFTRILIVLSFARSALGTHQIPPNVVLVGLALFLTMFTMAPVGKAINEQSLQPYLRHEIGWQEAGEQAVRPIREFMLRQTSESDLALFVRLGGLPRPHTPDDVPSYVLAPAFMVGELKRAFTMGFMIFLPFVVIDMVVATALMSMGMMMMPPVVISLPCKLLLFVLINGWQLVTESVVASFG